MKRTLVVAAALLLAFAAPVIAAEGDPPSEAPAPNLDQRKADIQKKLDTEIASAQEAKTCVQAATTQDNIKACMEKHKTETQQLRGENRKSGGRGRQQKP
jgi:hypothetical protein